MAEQTKENAFKLLKQKGWKAGTYLPNGVCVTDYTAKAKSIVNDLVKCILKKGK